MVSGGERRQQVEFLKDTPQLGASFVGRQGLEQTLHKTPLDSSTSTSPSFSNRQRMRAHEPVSFWRENEIAVVISL